MFLSGTSKFPFDLFSPLKLNMFVFYFPFKMILWSNILFIVLKIFTMTLKHEYSDNVVITDLFFHYSLLASKCFQRHFQSFLWHKIFFYLFINHEVISCNAFHWYFFLSNKSFVCRTCVCGAYCTVCIFF